MRTRNCNTAGALGEEFCKFHFDIAEGDLYEIKSTSSKNARIMVRPSQLIHDFAKWYVVIRYHRLRRRLVRGPRKGTAVFSESISSAFAKHLDIFTIRTVDLFKLIVKMKYPLRMTKVENDGDWAFYWHVLVSAFPDTILHEQCRFTIHGSEYDPPPFLDKIINPSKIPF